MLSIAFPATGRTLAAAPTSGLQARNASHISFSAHLRNTDDNDGETSADLAEPDDSTARTGDNRHSSGQRRSLPSQDPTTLSPFAGGQQLSPVLLHLASAWNRREYHIPDGLHNEKKSGDETQPQEGKSNLHSAETLDAAPNLSESKPTNSTTSAISSPEATQKLVAPFLWASIRSEAPAVVPQVGAWSRLRDVSGNTRTIPVDVKPDSTSATPIQDGPSVHTRSGGRPVATEAQVPVDQSGASLRDHHTASSASVSLAPRTTNSVNSAPTEPVREPIVKLGPILSSSRRQVDPVLLSLSNAWNRLQYHVPDGGPTDESVVRDATLISSDASMVQPRHPHNATVLITQQHKPEVIKRQQIVPTRANSAVPKFAASLGDTPRPVSNAESTLTRPRLASSQVLSSRSIQKSGIPADSKLTTSAGVSNKTTAIGPSNPDRTKIIPISMPPVQQAQSLQRQHPRVVNHPQDRISDASPNTDLPVTEFKSFRISQSDPAPTTSNPVAFSVTFKEPEPIEHQKADAPPAVEPLPPVANVPTHEGGKSHKPATEPAGSNSHPESSPKIEVAKEISHDAVLPVHSDAPPVLGPVIATAYPVSPGTTPRAAVKDISPPKPAVPDDPTPMPAPVAPRHIDLKLTNDDGYPVDVRISHRAGDVQMTVRTLDGDLSQSLRKHLPELSEHLSLSGTKGEFLHTALNQSSETPQGAGEQPSQQNQADQNSSDQNPYAKRNREKDQNSGSFAEIIQTEKESN